MLFQLTAPALGMCVLQSFFPTLKSNGAQLIAVPRFPFFPLLHAFLIWFAFLRYVPIHNWAAQLES